MEWSSPIEFGANERKYRQILRQGMVAILETRNHSDVVVSHEVVIIRAQKAGLVFWKAQWGKGEVPIGR
jgi:hypothetical protein